MRADQPFFFIQPILLVQHRLQFLLPVVELIMRLYVSKIFFYSGLSKLRDWEMTVALFTDEYHVPLLSPEVAAYLATGAELALPALLIVGLFRPIAAIGLFTLNMIAVVAYYSVLKDLPAALQDHIEWGLMLLLMACLPSNVLHLDHFLRKSTARPT